MALPNALPPATLLDALGAPQKGAYAGRIASAVLFQTGATGVLKIKDGNGIERDIDSAKWAQGVWHLVEVSQVKPLTMGWCLECHRDPSQNLRDPKDVTKMGMLEESEASGKPMPRPADARKPIPPQNCSGCHR